MASPDSLRSAITDLHSALADHPDPQSKQMITQALQMCLKVQANDYQHAQDQHSPRTAVLSTLGATG